MKALFFVLIASLFASEFQDIEEDEIKIGKVIKKVAPVIIKKVVPMIPKVGPIIAPFLAEEDAEDEVKFHFKLEIHNKDMFAPEFDDIDDEFKIKIGSIIKKLIPIVVPKIPYVGPIIAPFLSEEDMEPELVEYDQDELVELVLAELSEEYEMDASFWTKVGGFVKKVAPTVITKVVPMVVKKVVPMIPKVGPILAPFLAEEDELVMNMTNPFAKKIHKKPCPKPINGTKPHPRPHPRPHPKPVNGTKRHPRVRPLPKKFRKPIKKTPEPTVETELDEIKIGKVIKKVAPVIIKKVVPMIPKVGPIIAPFLAEEDAEDSDEALQVKFHLVLAEDDAELDDEFKIKIGSIIKKVLPIIAPHIPVVGPYIAPFLSEEDMEYMEDTADVYEPEIIDAVLAELIEEGYELDEGLLKKIGAYLKPRIPQIIRTIVPMIPKVGPKIAPIIEPFLAEEESDEVKCFCILAICTC